MFYFIPAWYNPWRPWYDTTEAWYRGGAHHFDDTINHLRLFEYAGQSSQLLVLNYMPNLRYFAHQYDLLEVSTWSLFDQIQNISNCSQRHIDFRSLNWPEGVEFIYTPFLVMVRQDKKRLATVEFGQDGQLIWVDYYDQEIIKHRYVFDDRGFVSSIIHYQDGQPHHQDYLNLAGQWQIREYLLPDDCHVEVATQEAHRFDETRYESMEGLVREKVRHYLLAHIRAEDALVVASHPQHNDFLLSLRGSGKLLLSYHQNRYDLGQVEGLVKDAYLSDLVVVDRLPSFERLRALGITNVAHLTPFDTRLSLGKSQRLKELVVYFLIDGLDEEAFQEYLSDIFVLMAQNEHINLALVTYDGDKARFEAKQAEIEALLEAEEAPYLFLDTREKTTMFEVIDEEEGVGSRVTLDHLGSEIAIQEALETARLIVDLSDEPDLYTQIAGISAGIPQVNKRASEFVEHLKNGYILMDEADLFIALDYYLTGLANWNHSLVHAVQKIEDYTSGRLVTRLLDKLGKHDNKKRD